MTGNISVEGLTVEQKESEKRMPRDTRRDQQRAMAWKPRKRELLEGSRQYGQVLEREVK